MNADSLMALAYIFGAAAVVLTITMLWWLIRDQEEAQ